MMRYLEKLPWTSMLSGALTYEKTRYTMRRMKMKAALVASGGILITIALASWLQNMYKLSPIVLSCAGLLISLSAILVRSPDAKRRLQRNLRIRAEMSESALRSSTLRRAAERDNRRHRREAQSS
jgi:hypothetical protein